MKKITNIFRILIMFGMLFVFTKCEESELQVENIDFNIENSGFRQLNFDELPIEIRQEFVSQTIPLNSAGTIARTRRSSLFGELKRDKVNQVKRENGSASYTIALEKNSKGFYYDNLVVQQDSLGNLRKNIIRYEPDKEWFEKSEGRYDYSNYTGMIYFFNEKEEMITSSYFNKGIPNSSKPFDLKGNIARQTSFGSSCSITPHFTGVELGGVIYADNIWFDIVCADYTLDSVSGEGYGGDTADTLGIGTTPMGEGNAEDGGGVGTESDSSENENENEKVCPNSFKFCNVGSNWQAAGIKNVNIQFATIGTIIGIQNIFFNELYIGFPKESSLIGGFLTNNNARFLAQEIMTEAESLTDLFYSINPNSTANQLRTYFYDKLGELVRNVGGQISTSAPLNWDCELVEHQTYFISESFECN